MKPKILVIFLFFSSFAFSQTTDKTACSDLKFKEYYYADKNTFQNGSIKLFQQNGKRFDALNKLILKNSENLLKLESEYNTLAFHKPDSTFDYSEENKKFQKWVEQLDLAKIFTLNSESQSYQKLVEKMQSNNEFGNISTDIFCLNKILVYHVEFSYQNDKAGPFNEFLNIDLNKMQLVDFGSLITNNQTNAFNKAVSNYANKHKKEIVNNYKQILSQGFGDSLYRYQLAFEKPDYNANKIICKINSANFSHFKPQGIVFTVNVTDKNRNTNEEREQIGEYVSQITIPYKEIINYLDSKNSLYSSINQTYK